MNAKRFNKRAFISLVTFFLGVAVLITGLMLLIMPDPTLAYWNKWTFLNLDKIEWEQFHAVASIYFSLIVVLHIIENWKPMLSYMKKRTNKNFTYKRELIASIFVSAVITAGSFTSSPVAAVVEVFEPISESWYAEEYEPPFEDAQGLPLKLLARVQDLNDRKIDDVFRGLGIDYSLDQTLEEIAENSAMSSRDLYELIQ